MLRLLAKCGDPHMDLPTTVHVTGTNGKGSVVAYTSHLLVANGVRTAAFTSPHPAPLYSDALTVDCAGVADSVFGAAVAKVKEQIDSWDTPLPDCPEPGHVSWLRREKDAVSAGWRCAAQRPSQFEAVTAACFYAVARLIDPKPEVFVLEVGLGGRTDATNAILPPACAAFTSIHQDHGRILGDTPEAIAEEKSGIVKPGTRSVLSYPQTPSVAAILQRAAAASGVSAVTVAELPPAASDDDVFPAHQRLNYSLAAAIVRALSAQGAIATEAELFIPRLSAVHAGSMTEGRFETYSIPSSSAGENDLPRYVIFDGAHNPQAVSGLNEAIELFLARHAKVSSVVVVVGVLKDKDVGKICSLFSDLHQRVSQASRAAVVFSPVDVPHQPRSTPSAALRESLIASGIPAKACFPAASFNDTITRNVAGLLQQKPAKGVAVIVTGSFYLLKTAREYFSSRYSLVRTVR
ncbi:Folylpolyglutamate synthase [Diplonema papillatum]|nr:Folylpolyglutamate synthase [Diplonema papillatum]